LPGIDHDARRIGNAVAGASQRQWFLMREMAAAFDSRQLAASAADTGVETLGRAGS